MLQKLFPQASWNALGAGVSSRYRVEEAAHYTNLSIEEVVKTKCRLIADTLAYLLSYQPYDSPEEKVGWWIRLRGVNKFEQSTSVGHALLVVEGGDGKTYLIDSYIGCRSITCREIDMLEFLAQLKSLQKQYDPRIWLEVTGCEEREIPDHVHIIMQKYSYDDSPESIVTRYLELQNNEANPKYGHRRDFIATEARSAHRRDFIATEARSAHRRNNP
jgi:hypothetical protein